VIEVSKLNKRYGAASSASAVKDVSFGVAKGEVVGFLGPNGAGKTTTLRILAGSLAKTSGEVKIAGFDVELDPVEAKKRIGYMPEAVPLYPEMRVVEYLRFRAELKRVARKDRKGFVEEAMEQANVTDVATMVIGKLSKGYRQRVGLADALVAKPEVLILDEPTAGLDPNQIRDVRDVVKELGKDRCVLLSTHILSEVEASCTRVLLIDKGKLVAEGPTGEIKSMRRGAEILIVARGDEARAKEALPKAKVEGGELLELRLEGDDEEAERAVLALVTAGIQVREVRRAGGSLEEVFAALTERA
jgi:ABC-2 type transport system ATP-binding protein